MPNPSSRMSSSERELYAQGRTSFERGEIDRAMESLSPLLERKVGFADLHYMVGVMLDQRGEIRHRGGVTEEPGLYVLGLRFQRRKNSNFIDGVGNDAAELTQHLIKRSASRAA